jgi:putative tricarboxylic transport membrane protein
MGQILHEILSLHGILALLLGTVAGLFLGALPGIGPAVGIALLLPLSFYMPVGDALLFYVSLYQAAEYGGSITAIAFATPGSPNSAATIPDGYGMTKRGQPGKAFSYSLWSAIFGSYVGIAGLFALTMPISAVALALGSPEFAALGVFALAAISSLTAKAPLEGLTSAVLGLLFSTVGLDLVTNTPRFTFGSVSLSDGVSILPALVGLFAIAEALRLLSAKSSNLVSNDAKDPGRYRVWLSWKEFRAVLPTTIMGSVVGFFFGLLPGLSGSVPPWITYNIARSASKRPEEFGTGIPEGIVAPEATNAAVMHSTLIPMLTLGIPGTPTSAIIMGAMMIGGLAPGPLLMTNNANIVYELFFGLIISTAALWILGLATTRLWVRTLSIPRRPLAIGILVLCIFGSFVQKSNPFHIVLAFFFGVLGYVMDRFGFSVPAMILGLIIGPIIESNLRRALYVSDGSFMPFVQSPIALAFLIASVLVVILGIVQQRRLREKASKKLVSVNLLNRA